MTWEVEAGFYDCLERFPTVSTGPHTHPVSHPVWHKMGRPSRNDPTVRVCREQGCNYLERYY